MTVSSANYSYLQLKFWPMIVRKRRIRQLRANCPLYDDLISEDSNLFSEIDLSIFDEPFLEEVDHVDFLKEVKRCKPRMLKLTFCIYCTVIHYKYS